MCMIEAMRAEPVRDPACWIEDMTWHRRMFRQSNFRWVPEDPMAIALTWTRGRLSFETPRHLRFLDEQLLSLRDFAAQIDDAMLAPLTEAEHRLPPADWHTGLELVGLTRFEIGLMRRSAPRTITPNHEAQRAVRGIPLPNPFSQVWELRQMRSLYTAAENLLEDAFSDLATELAPEHGWHNLAQLTLHHRSAKTLQLRVEHQRELRGAPGDPRRIPVQRY